MSPEAQRIAIAMSLGWDEESARRGFETTVREQDGYTYSQISTKLPDYLNDLNAIHEAVKRLPQNLKPRYFACLCTVVSGAISLHGYAEATEATAAQRCEAFLKTIEKWEE
jgi:hypothetical protein